MYREYQRLHKMAPTIEEYNKSCPGNRLRWDLKKEEYPTKAQELMDKTKKVYDAVGALKKDEVGYDNVIKVCSFSVSNK